MSLSGRVGLAAVVAVVACVLGVAGLVYTLEERALRDQIDADLTSYAAAVSERLLSSGEVDEVIRSGPLDVSPYYAQVVRDEGDVVALSSTRPLLPVDEATRELAQGRGDRFFDDVEVRGSQVRVLAVPTPGGALQVAREVEEADLQMLQLTGVITLAGGAGALLALVVGLWVARVSLRPVRRLAAESESIATNRDFSARLAVQGEDELSRLATSLNVLLDALDDSLRTQRQLVADASHELKTPLTGLRTELDLAARNGSLEHAARLRFAVDDLVTAVDDLVELARDRPAAETADEVDLADVVRECVSWTLRQRPGVRIEVDLEPCRVRAVRSQVARAVSNLLDNAVKHAPSALAVEVSLRGGVLRVRDHGGGVASRDLPHVFERFYRSADARQRAGAGLGLAIVRKVADEHGWRVWAENAVGGGAVFCLGVQNFDRA
jgi:two-component system sensor histidine kinase MprB